MAAEGSGRRTLPARVLPLALSVLLAAAGPAVGAPARAASPRPSKPSAAAPAPPDATLGPYSAALEGTWEFRSMTIPKGPKLEPPGATGVIVIDKGVVLAASYVPASPTRKVGNLWEGRMILTADSFDIVPEKGVHYDSAAKEPVTASLPPRSKGTITRDQTGIVLRKADGSTVTFEGAGRRVQRDADGTVIVHERTSLVPRVPENLPGREP